MESNLMSKMRKYYLQKLSKSDIAGDPHHPERIYNYFCVHLKQVPQPAFILDISEFFEQKMKAVACYHSQFIEGRPTNPSFLDRLRDEAAFWGKAIGVEYGEPFACREPIGMSDFGSLI